MKGRLSGPLSSHELWWVIGFCLFAAVRVLFFSAAFPFFNNVDERRHFDLVIKYAEGHVPRGAELISPATLPYLSHYASPEFLSAPENFEGGYFGPMWKHPAEEVAPTIARIEEIWSRTPNQECSQPPPYYVVAAAWFHIGQWIGFKDGGTLYWVRLLNTVLVAALVWLAYVAARLMFPEQIALRLGVPLLIAAVPQDAFYGINNDVLSPICFGLVFICLIKWFSQDELSVSLGIATGLSIAAAYLAKAQQRANNLCRRCRDFVVVHRQSSSGKIARSNACVDCAGILCRNSNRGVACLDEGQFRRFHRRHLESTISWMDNETVLGLVVASNFHRVGNVDVPLRTYCQLLARRIYVARAHYWFQRNGFVLRPFLPRPACYCRHFIRQRAREKHQPGAAPLALDRSGVRRRNDRVPRVLIATVRFWCLYQPISRAACTFSRDA